MAEGLGDSSDFTWPPNSWLGKHIGSGAWQWEDDFFLNSVVSASQIPGWVTVTSGALVGSVPAPTDVATRGQATWTLTRSGGAPVAGWRRSQGTNFIGIDGYSATDCPEAGPTSLSIPAIAVARGLTQ